MKKIILLLMGMSLLLITGQAQNKKIAKADELLKAGEYYNALEIYTKLYPKLKDKSEKAHVAFNAGLCARNMQNPQGAIMWFSKAKMYRYQDPLLYLYLADASLMKGQYDNAKKYYQTYKDLVPNDERADNGIKSCDLAQQWMEKPSRYIIKPVVKLNSKQNDFAPAISNDTNTLYFTSTRPAGKGEEINGNSGQYFSDIYVAVKDKKGIWSQPVPVPGDINTPFDDGSCTLTADGRTMYFTSCQKIENKKVGCKIYKSTLQGEKWSAGEEVPIFSDTAISVGQPCLSKDGLVMYFVSDNPQGKGGTDIWMMKRTNPNSDKWSPPTNLGSDINTKYDELFPALDKDGNLYFSSNGRIGMGGFDIYKATPKKGGGWTVENLKYPINSSANDLAIVFNPYSMSGYFSSSRVFLKGDDIYHFYLKPLTIKFEGYVRNDVNHAYLPDATVELTGSDGSMIKVKTDATGKFSVKLHENVDYSVSAYKHLFLKSVSTISTKGIKEDGKILTTEIYLKPATGVVKIPNIRYDFNDTTLREESKVALDELIELLKVNPNVKIELLANTDYRGSEEANMKLSQGRANSVVDYLVAHGIKRDRLVPKGYGESRPFVVDELTAKKYPFLKVGDTLTEEFIKSLPNEEEQEICNELNRRTEFKVISTDFKENYQTFGSE